MSVWQRLRVFFPACLCLVMLVAASTTTMAKEDTFFDKQVSDDAERYSGLLNARSYRGNPAYKKLVRRGFRRIISLGDKALQGGNAKVASDYFAVAASSSNRASAWLKLASSLLVRKPANYSERYKLPERAGSAAWLAYKSAKTPQTKAQALALLGQALTKRSLWRKSLKAYKASLATHDNPGVQSIYEDLRKKHGFRIVNYSADSDASQPRLCIQFSENLPKGRIDWGKYFITSVEDEKTGLKSTSDFEITAKDAQACIDGLQHGRRYSVEVRAGVPSTVDERLEKNAILSVYVRDRKPSVHFKGRAYVLPRTGQNGIPLVTVNAQSIDIEIFSISDRTLSEVIRRDKFKQQLDGYSADQLKDNLGKRIFTGTLKVSKKLNKDVTTAFPVNKAIAQMKPGVYVMTAQAAGGTASRWDTRATQWFLVSDLGLTSVSGDDGLHGFVRSLTSAQPLKNIEVKLIARNNEVLASIKTDADGYAHFAAGLTRGEGGLAPSVMVANGKDGDYGFLNLTAAAFDLSDRGVTGREAPGPIDSYVFTERGVYRPGAQVHITALTRDAKAKAQTGLPLTLVIDRPDGVEHTRVVLKDQGLGGRSFSLPLLDDIQTGTWRIRTYIDVKNGEPVGTASFLVEDFVPERLKLTLTAKDKNISPGQTVAIAIDGQYLYGAPAGGLRLEGEVTVTEETRYLENFKGYSFGLADEKITAKRRPLKLTTRVDEKGKAVINAALPNLPETSKLLKADVTIRMVEASGRAIERTTSLSISPVKPLIGIKPGFNELAQGETATFDIAVVGMNEKQISLADLSWELVRVTTKYQWYNNDGSWNYDSVKITKRIASGNLSALAAKPVRITAPVKWGEYRLEVFSKAPDGPAASYDFSAGWYAAEGTDTPDILEIALDKSSYEPGDIAKLRIVPPGEGKALITVLGAGLVSKKLVDVPAGGLEVALPVDEKWGSGAYVTAHFYRAISTTEKRMPGRAIGIKYLNVGANSHNLKVSLDTPAKARPDDLLEVPVKLSGLAAGEEAYIVASAVDVGILNLTGYKPPSPSNWFFAQKKLSVELRDLYGQLIDGMQAAAGQIRSGGDGPGGMSTSGEPPAQKPLALFSGIIKVDKKGTALIPFDIPGFNGTVKVMVAAWSKDRVGQASADVIIRDRLVVSGTTPRFMAMNDTSRLHLELDNVEGPAGRYKLLVTSEGLSPSTDAPYVSEFPLKEKQRVSQIVLLRAVKIGEGLITARLVGPAGIDIVRSFAINIKPAYPSITRRTVQSLAAKGKLSISKDVFTGLIASTAKVSLSVGPKSLPDVPGLLASLDRYPYGCSEQITSKALPLLYLSSVAEKAGIAENKGEEARKRVKTAISKLMSRQIGDGAFGLWSADDGGLWLTAYVTDFLTRAREQGFSVPERGFSQALDRLSNAMSYAGEFDKGGENIAYALYVLARNKRARIGDLRYYSDEKGDAFGTAMAQAQLASALALYGEKTRASKLFGKAVARLKTPAKNNLSRNDFGSGLRDRAAALTLASESGLRQSIMPALLSQMESQSSWQSSARTSTQENAWLLLAANALFEDAKSFRLSLGEEQISGPLFRTISARDLVDPVSITNRGDAQARAVVTITGAPLVPEPAASNGFSIKRLYYDLAGKLVDPRKVTQNDRMIVVLKVFEGVALGGQILVEDFLPAGFEIDNPRLINSADMKAFAWLPKGGNQPTHTEFRDDRFVAAFKLKGSKPGAMTMAYMVRAVAPGKYAHPPAMVEDMYRPERYARTAAGKVEVVRRR